MELMNIKSAFSYLKTFYGIDVKESDFEEIALSAWELIGNKHTELKRFVGNTQNCFLELPCDLTEIESVHIPIIDANTTGVTFNGPDVESIATEHYIEAQPSLDSPYYQSGKLIKYKLAGNSLQFERDFNNVMVVYHSVITDHDDLPMINDKEMRAIASYVAYASTYKEGIMKKNGDLINLANSIKQDWLRFCNAARISSSISQNDMDAILDVKTSWDRKKYGKSYRIK